MFAQRRSKRHTGGLFRPILLTTHPELLSIGHEGRRRIQLDRHRLYLQNRDPQVRLLTTFIATRLRRKLGHHGQQQLLILKSTSTKLLHV